MGLRPAQVGTPMATYKKKAYDEATLGFERDEAVPRAGNAPEIKGMTWRHEKLGKLDSGVLLFR